MKDFRNSPIIKAQEICKETVVKIANEVIPMYQSAVEDLTINDYDVDMEPWNNGYELTIKPIFDFTSIKGEISVYDRFRFFVQPSSFFNKDFSNNEASFEIGISFGGFKSMNERQPIKGEIKIDNTKILMDVFNLIKL